MTDGPSPIELEEFELIQASAETALLRVTARAPAWVPREPTLLIHDETRVHRLRPLPSPRDPEGWLRAAYSVRTSVLEREPSYSLELSQSSRLALPHPRRGTQWRPPSERTTTPVPASRTESAESRPTPPRKSIPEEDLKLIQLQAKALEANRWAAETQQEVERLTSGNRELVQALQAASRAHHALDDALETLQARVEERLTSLESDLLDRRNEETAAAAERSAEAAERIRRTAIANARARDEWEIRAALSGPGRAS